MTTRTHRCGTERVECSRLIVITVLAVFANVVMYFATLVILMDTHWGVPVRAQPPRFASALLVINLWTWLPELLLLIALFVWR